MNHYYRLSSILVSIYFLLRLLFMFFLKKFLWIKNV